jgi:hypothetical protein
MAFGAEVLISDAEDVVIIKVELQWNCYYRVFPTLTEQREYQRQTAPAQPVLQTAPGADDGAAESGDDNDPADDGDDTPARSPTVRRRGRQPTDSLFPKFKKAECAAGGLITFRRASGTGGMAWIADVDDLDRRCKEEFARVRGLVLEDPEHLRVDADAEDSVRVPTDVLRSESDFAAFKARYVSELPLPWEWSISASTRPGDAPTCVVVGFEATNTSAIDTRSWHSEGFFFDARATFAVHGGTVAPFELELAPKGFRHDKRLWGRGFNCALYRSGEDSDTIFTTSAAPIYSQSRYVTNEAPPARFDDLATDPAPVLAAISLAMNSYLEVWTEQRATYCTEPAWESRYGAEFDRDLEVFRDEILRFDRGRQLIETDADVRLAFQLTNRTFAAGGKTAWRLFQIVFIVSQVPGIHALASAGSSASADRLAVDIVYFPTGGGKTEAYLGVIIFHCFFDRLRGKTAGVTTWTRFPLRLLTLQQTQRVADAIGAAELLRLQQTDPRLSAAGVDRFAVGYFVGEEATPNELSPPRQGDAPDAHWSKANDPEARQAWKKIGKCPACRTASIVVDFDPVTATLPHRCTNAGCAFPSGLLPIHIVDNEIYRFLPSVIVGTIDKLAGVGNQRKLSLVLGDVRGKCSQHGYYNGKCCQKDCSDARRLRPGAPPGVSGPTLFIQDELHLLKEGLGTFDGHYETFVQTLLARLAQNQSVKVIASSATIEAFERQILHLYGRTARVFPGPGPTLASSFYARTNEYPQRLFIGILPHNKTIFNAVLELIQYYREEVEALSRLEAGSANPFGGQLFPGTPEWRALLDSYLATVTYFSASRDLSSTRTDLESHVNTELDRLGLPPLRLAELSGDTSTDNVTRILEQLETGQPETSAPDTVLATSMISHGVDIDRLNCMFFYGMPKQNAEYIQSSSRVGRSHVGLVFVCLKPARERDQSHFAYFDKYHEFLGRLVEPVAINRWSKFSIQRTLPGLFMGVLLQYIANRSGQSNPNRYYMVDFVKQQIADGAIRDVDFLEILRAAYLLDDPSHPGAALFGAELPARVRQFIDQILGAGGGATFVSEALVPRPMRSLRHVDEQVEIELDTNGGAWATRTGR